MVVKNTSAAASAASVFTVNGPKINSLTPSSIIAGSSATTITIAGNNFIAGTTDSGGAFTAGSTAYLGSTQLTVTAGTASSITATVPSSALVTPGAQSVTIRNTSTAVSTGATLNVNGPKITSLSPNTIAAGAAQFTMTVTGTNFLSDSTIVWGTTSLTTTYVNSTHLTAVIAAAQVANAGTSAVYVTNPRGAASAPVTFTVGTPPTLSVLSPSSATNGGAQFTLTLTGTKFVSGAVVNWGSTPLTTAFVSATSLTATVPASDIASAGSATVTVVNPDGSSTSGATFTIN
jgi:hypothetical protein